MSLRVGVAGWSIPADMAEHFGEGGGTHLQRYATRLPAVEINTSFYRPHRRQTYERWASSVPAEFRFSVKLPRAITHERRLVDCGDLLQRFAEETAGLGEKRGPVLIQLPPSLHYPGPATERFLEEAKRVIGAPLVLEPRHASWFAPDVDRMLAQQRVSRVAADPAKPTGAGTPGGWTGLTYHRLHGSPRIYQSPYDGPAVQAQAEAVASLAAQGVETWTIYDNTTFGAATRNALELLEALERREG